VEKELEINLTGAFIHQFIDHTGFFYIEEKCDNLDFYKNNTGKLFKIFLNGKFCEYAKLCKVKCSYVNKKLENLLRNNIYCGLKYYYIIWYLKFHYTKDKEVIVLYFEKVNKDNLFSHVL